MTPIGNGLGYLIKERNEFLILQNNNAGLMLGDFY